MSVLTRRTLLTQALFLAGGAGAAILLRDYVLWPLPTVSFPAGTSSGVLEFGGKIDAPLITVQVMIGDLPARALIDTGAQISVIDRTFVQTHALASFPGAPMLAFGVGGGAQLAQGLRLSLAIGGARVNNLNAAVVNLGPLAGIDGLATPLVIGQDVLCRLVVDVDFPERRVELKPPGAVRPHGAREAPVVRRGRSLMAQAHVEGRPIDLVVDTGASGLLSLARPAAREAGLLSGRRVRPSTSIVLGGVDTGGLITVSSLDFAGRRWRDVEAHIFAAPPAPWFPPGLLGVQAISSGRAIIDIGGGRLELSPGATSRPAVLRTG
jgi:predicted aspartyl protease